MEREIRKIEKNAVLIQRKKERRYEKKKVDELG